LITSETLVRGVSLKELSKNNLNDLSTLGTVIAIFLMVWKLPLH
jgi:hypothetical protein